MSSFGCGVGFGGACFRSANGSRAAATARYRGDSERVLKGLRPYRGSETPNGERHMPAPVGR